MSLSRLLFVVSAVFLVLAIADFIGTNYAIRFAGQNLLNIRLWLLLLVSTSVLVKPSLLSSNSIKWLIAYFLIYFIMALIGHYDLWDFSRSTRLGWFRNQHFALAAAVIFSELALAEKNSIVVSRLVNISLITLFTICLLSITIILRNPGVVRGTDYRLYGAEMQRYRALGLGSYSFFSSLPFLIPVLAYKIKNRIMIYSARAYQVIVLLIVLIITSYMAVIVAPFLLSIVVLLLAVLGRRRIRANLALILLMSSIFILTPKSWIAGAFFAASNSVDNRDISLKLSEIGHGFAEGFSLVTYDDEAATGIEGRASRILYNLLNFSRSPFIGSGQQSNAHIYWLNLLAQFGLIGVVPLVFILRTLFKKNLHSMCPESWFTYYLTIAAFVTLGFMKAMGGYIMFIVPLFLVPAMIRLEEEWLIRHRFPKNGLGASNGL